jgi:protein O-mannosyl-transferase
MVSRNKPIAGVTRISSDSRQQPARIGPSPRTLALFGALLIAGLVLLTYWPAIHGGFVLDDDLLLTDNPLIKAPDGLYRIWFTRQSVDYWPVTNSSFWAQWRLWGMNPTGYHVTNLLLHIADCLLIWLLLKRISIPGGFIAALLFAVHPVNVESVAWIAQQKNLLSLLFFLLSLLWYSKSQYPVATNLEKPPRRRLEIAEHHLSPWNRWYVLSLLAFVVAMLSKGSVAILPLVLLLIIWWQRGQINMSDLWRMVPFFSVAIALTIVNIWFQTHGAVTAIRSVTFAQRLAGAGAALWFYLFKAILPLNLVLVYPQWNIDISNPLWWLPFAAAVAVTIVLIRAASFTINPWPRNLLFAWGFFNVALLPVLGFVDVGYMRYSLVADHYQYIALIGVLALVAAAGTYWYHHTPQSAKAGLAIIAIAVVANLAFLTSKQSRLYANSFTLYEYTLQQNPASWLTHTNLSVDLANANRPQEARDHAQEALRLKPNYADAHCALGVALAKLGQTDQAIQEYRQALDLDPSFAEAACNLGAALGGKGQLPEAVHYLERAVALKPHSFEAHSNLGRALASVGRLPEALEQLKIAVQLHPDYAEGEINMGNIAHALNHNQEALSHFQQALQIKPNFPEAYVRIALVYAEMNRPADAVSAAETGINTARSVGDSDLAQQLETWLTNYRAQQLNPPTQNH